MSVTAQTPVNSYTANGATTEFPFAFTILDSADLKVKVAGIFKTEGTDYTVTGVGNPSGGSIIFTMPPDNGLTVQAYRSTRILRETDYQENGDLPASTVNLDFDRLWYALQELLAGLFGDAPTPGDATDLLARLINQASALDGAGIVGYNPALSYAAGTVGAALRATAGGPGFIRLKADAGCVGDGVADDTTAIRAAIATAAEGATLVCDGLFRITDTLVVNKRVSFHCFGADAGILVEVGTAKDGIVFYGTNPVYLNGLNGLSIQLNVYGRANACRDAVVMKRVDRSRIFLNIRAGATDYGLRIRGCLINNWHIESTTNYAPPISSWGTQYHHMVVENFGVPLVAKGTCSISNATPAVCTFTSHGLSANDCVVFNGTVPSGVVEGKPYYVLSTSLTANTFKFSATLGGTAVNTTSSASPTLSTASPVATNTNRFWLNLEGCHDGYLQTAMPGEGQNTIAGEIEGLAGNPLYVEECKAFHFGDVKMEANAGNCFIRGAESLQVGPAVLNYPSGPALLQLRNCKGYTIDGYYGSLDIDNSNQGGRIGNVASPNISSNIIADRSAEQSAPISNALDTTVFAGGPGASSMVNLFSNPYLDLWAQSGSGAPPIGTTSPSVLVNRVTSPVYPGNPNIYSCRVTTDSATINSGLVLAPSFNPIQNDNYISVLVPVYVATGQPGVSVYLHDGVNYHLIFADTTTKDQWMEVRGTIKHIAGNNFKIYIATWNGSGYPSGAQFYVGGCSMVYGAVPPKTIDDSGRRRANIISVTTYAPDFVGQIAKTGAGDLYMAKDTSANTDWLKISP